MPARVMVLYDSRAGLVSELAQSVCAGVASVDGAELLERVVDDADPSELLEIDALILGSPNWTGITGKLKGWMDETGDLWESGDLIGKPGGAFTAGWSPHAGIEATLLQLFHLLVGHGMVFVGIPWSDLMRRSGSYYGATAYAEVTEEDRQQAHALGQRVAEFAIRLKA